MEKTPIGLARLTILLTGAVVFSIDLIYKDLLYTYMLLYLRPEYSYMYAALFALIVLGISVLRNVSGATEIHSGRILVAATLFVFSITIYVYSRTVNKYSVELGILSMVLLIWGFFAIMFSSSSFRKLGTLPALLLLLVPLPREVIHGLAESLSTCIAQASSVIAGVEPGVSREAIGTSNRLIAGYTGIYSGVAAVFSIIPTMLLLIHVLLYKRSTGLKSLVAVVASASSGLLAVLAGNIIGFSALALLSRYWHNNSSIMVFYNILPYLIVFASVSTMLYTASRLLHSSILAELLHPTTRSVKDGEEHVVSLEPRSMLYILFIVALFLAGFTGIYTPRPDLGWVRRGEPIDPVYAVNSLVDGTGISVANVSTDPFMARLLGSIAVLKIVFSYGSNTYTGYIDLSLDLDLLRSWGLGLVYQGYYVEDEWAVLTGNVTAVVVVLGGSSSEEIFVYSIYRIPLHLDGNVTYVYARLGVYGSRDDVERILGIMSEIGSVKENCTPTYRLLSTLSTILLGLTIVIATYISYSLLTYVRSRWSKWVQEKHYLYSW